MREATASPESPRLAAVVVLALAAVHLLVAVAPAARSPVSDDMVFVVPIVVTDAEGRSLWGAIGSLLAPDRAYLHRVAHRLYVLGTVWLLGPANAGLVWGGAVLHMACSALLWPLARRIGMSARVAWLAAGLHLTAWAGFHASLWPSAVQHVLASLGVLAVLNLYLATEQRREASARWQGLYAATAAVAMLSSLSRASSLIAPAAIMAHALLRPGSAAERLRRYDLWAPVVAVAAVYPLALMAWATDAEVLGALPTVANLMRRSAFTVGPPAVLAGAMAYALLLLGLGRGALALWARSSWAARAPLPRAWRRVLRAAALLAAAPWLVRLGVVAVWGVEAFLWPVGIALASHSTFRWHMTSLPVDVVGAGCAAALLVVFVRRHARNLDLLPLAVVLAGFGYAVYAWEPRPLRYWIYITPALSILVAAGMEAAVLQVGRAGSAVTRRREMVLVAAVAVVALSNIAAIRLELWRHRVADAYMTLDYARVADLIRLDLEAARAPRDARICVDGLAPPPNHREWRKEAGQRARFTEYNATSALAQALGRSDVSAFGIGCGAGAPAGTYAYVAEGARVLRDGRSVDLFEALHARLRERVASGDFAGALALTADRAASRPFLVRFLLEERLPDDDLLWATGGVSVLDWLDRIAANHDHWYGVADPTIAALRDLARAEITEYVRFLFLAQYAHSRVPARSPGWEEAGRRLPFGGIPLAELARLVRQDAFLASQPEMEELLEGIVSSSSYSGSARTLGQPRGLTTLPLLAFLARLVLNDLGA